MADLKISQLSSATTPLAGTEVLPIVQSGATVKVAVSNLTAGRTQTSNGIVQGTAATGYNFTANTPAAGMTSQLLNWYEEGNWTPTLTPGSGSITVSENAGYYTRVGRLVTFNCLLNIASVSSPSGAITLNGLPFTCKNNNAAFAACSVFAYGLIAGTSTQIMASVDKNATTIAVYGFASSTGTYVNLASAVQAGAQFQIAGAYVV
jgi:hypothetical protein